MEQKTLLIAGASSDLAAAILKEVASRYDTIWAHYGKGADAVKKLRDQYGEKILPIQADFANEDDVRRMIGTIAESGNLPDHIVHLSADKLRYQKFAKTDPTTFARAYTVGVQSAVMLLRAFLPPMAKRKYGRVVLTASIAASDTPPKYMSAYATSKYALLGLMKSLAEEYRDKNVAINAVSPDMIDTRFLDDVPDLIKETAAAQNPDGKLLSTEEVARVYAGLLSDDAAFVTGQNIPVVKGVT